MQTLLFYFLSKNPRCSAETGNFSGRHVICTYRFTSVGRLRSNSQARQCSYHTKIQEAFLICKKILQWYLSCVKRRIVRRHRLERRAAEWSGEKLFMS
jgi:hypothetical protein